MGLDLLKGVKIEDIPNYDETSKLVFAVIATSAMISLAGNKDKGLRILANTAKQITKKLNLKMVNVAISEDIH
jgi:hypothetical protein